MFKRVHIVILNLYVTDLFKIISFLQPQKQDDDRSYNYAITDFNNLIFFYIS